MNADLIIRSLPDYRITVRRVHTGHGDVDEYTLSDSEGTEHGRGPDYDILYRRMVVLQEAISSHREPKGYDKVSLLSIGWLHISRTVDRDADGKLVWVYIAEDADGNIVLTDGNLINLCKRAVVTRKEVKG